MYLFVILLALFHGIYSNDKITTQDFQPDLMDIHSYLIDFEKCKVDTYNCLNVSFIIKYVMLHSLLVSIL